MQNKLPKLNLPAIELRLRRTGESMQLFDSVRRSYIVLTPEEWVRRHVIGWLVDHLKVAQTQIILEFPVLINGQRLRADVVVVDKQGNPIFVCECKAPEVKLTQETMDQAIRYNYILSAKFVMLTNGLRHHIYERLDSEGNYRAISSISELKL